MRRGACGTAGAADQMSPLLLDHCHHAMHFLLMLKETGDVLVKDRQKHGQQWLIHKKVARKKILSPQNPSKMKTAYIIN